MKTVTIPCDHCGTEIQMEEALANNNSIKGHYCSEECWIKDTEELNSASQAKQS